MTLASENYRSGQPISEYIQNNLAPHFSPDLINPQHFCHSARRKPVRLSKSGNTRQQLHEQIAEALATDSPEMVDTQPELFARHYAEAGLVEKSVDFWGKAGRRSAARSAMAEAAAQFQKALDQLALLPDDLERQR